MNKTHIEIAKGLDIPIDGQPDQNIIVNEDVEFNALLGSDYNGLKPKLAIQEGDQVAKGSPLFVSKVDESVVYTAPVSGKVAAINRGHRRALVSVVIAADGKNSQVSFKSPKKSLSEITATEVAGGLQESGLWTALRTRPFSKVPLSSVRPDAIFINAMANDSYAANPEIFLKEHLESFIDGVRALARLATKQLFICCHPASQLLEANYSEKNITVASFSGKYPASLSGTHMHFLYPAGRMANNFWINYQDVIAIGRFFSNGEIMQQRLFGLGGPVATKPQLIKSSLGANIRELTQGKLNGTNNRLIAGGIMNGRACTDESDSFIGRYHLQLAALDQGNKREFMGWLSWGLNKFSNQAIYLSSINPKKLFNLNTSTNGSDRAMVPMSTYEKVMPMNILSTQLLRSLLVGDIEMAERLGCLELDEEDLSLCSFVCSGKYEYGTALRHNLSKIEKENWDI